MPRSHSQRLIMLGAAPETRGSIGAVIDAYRAHGLFARWPVEHLALRSDDGWRRRATLSALALRDFAWLAARHPRSVLHMHSEAGAGFWRDALFMAGAAALRCPVVLQLHGSGFGAFYDQADVPVRSLIRLALARASFLVVPADSMRAWVHSVCREARVASVPPPVALPEPGAPLATRPPLVLFLGRLDSDTGVIELIDAIAAVRAAVPDVRLVCAGEGDRGAVLAHAERRGVADAVKFTGWVGPSGKRVLLDSAAVLAMPSYAAGLPMGLLEAMAAGVPVVASAVGGVPEVVVDGISGFLAAPGDRATLARLVRKLLLDRQAGERVGAAARETVRVRFAPDKALARLEEVYIEAGLSLQGAAHGSHRRLDSGIAPSA
jgi:glycosyltransferase involved in cell wall biosynthesis